METAANELRKWGQTVTFDVVAGCGIGDGDDGLCRSVGDSDAKGWKDSKKWSK